MASRCHSPIPCGGCRERKTCDAKTQRTHSRIERLTLYEYENLGVGTLRELNQILDAWARENDKPLFSKQVPSHVLDPKGAQYAQSQGPTKARGRKEAHEAQDDESGPIAAGFGKARVRPGAKAVPKKSATLQALLDADED